MRIFFLATILFAAGALTALAQTGKPVNYHNPSWSPDGKQIVFESDRDGKFAVYTINTDGSQLTKLTNGAANDEQPRWSKDGRKIVYISDRDGAFHIYLMQRDGSGQMRVSNSSRAEFIPDLSPNGEQVVFVSGDSTYLISIKSKKKRSHFHPAANILDGRRTEDLFSFQKPNRSPKASWRIFPR